MAVTFFRSHALVLTAFLTGSCATPNAQYQTSANTVLVAGSSYREGVSKYRLRAIEFDEQGIRWSNEQRSSALAAIRDTSRSPLLIVFIHGWHHNARPNDTDLQSFDRLLAKLSDNKAAVGADIVGVYIGWRGLSAPRETDVTGLLRYTSFYSRKHATDRLAGIGLTQTLYELGNAAHRRGGHAIFVGHSFGGRILERAIAQGLIGQSSGADGGRAVQPPADLTLLLNPAAEALGSRELKLALQNWEGRTPPIISLTSRNDSATKLAWPFATKTSSIFDHGYRPLEKGVSERRFVTHTAGHFAVTIDRQVTPAPAPPSEIPADAVEWNLRYATAGCIRAADAWWQIKEVGASTDPNVPYVINGEQARGYWIVQVPKEIINGHGGIFNESAIDFITGLYKMCRNEIRTRRSVNLAPVLLDQ
ncbi:MAG: hypothetical protein ABI946_03825 [Chthoniobacterales bacterium]